MRNDMTRLGDLCEFRYGKSLPAQSRREGPVPVYGSNGVVGSHDEAITNGKTIVIGRKGSIGEINVSANSCWPIDTTYYVDADATEVDINWLSGALSSLRLSELNKAAAVPGLNRNDAYEERLFVPRLDEQRRIAAILDKADALRQKRKRAIALLDSLTQSIFLEMFGDPEANPKDWPIVDFGDVIQEGPNNGLYKPASYYGSGTPILRIDAFYDGAVTDISALKRLRTTDKERTTFELREGDIVINRVNSLEYLGKSAIIPALSEPTVFESNMMRLRVDNHRVTPSFCIAYLQTDYVKMQIARKAKKAVNQASINQGDVRSLSFYLPPIQRQKVFQERLQEVQKTGMRLRSQDHFNTLFSSLQHRAFSGQL